MSRLTSNCKMCNFSALKGISFCSQDCFDTYSNNIIDDPYFKNEKSSMDLTENCPNCNEPSTVFGICGSHDCYAGQNYSLLCEKCYDDHVKDSHYWFIKRQAVKILPISASDADMEESAWIEAKSQALQALQAVKSTEMDLQLALVTETKASERVMTRSTEAVIAKRIAEKAITLAEKMAKARKDKN